MKRRWTNQILSSGIFPGRLLESGSLTESIGKSSHEEESGPMETVSGGWEERGL